MNIKGLLAYAAIDDELTALNRKYAEFAEVKDYQLQARRKRESAGALVRLNTEAGEVVNSMNSLSAQAAEVFRQLEEAKSNVEHIEDEKEADYYSKNIEKLLAQLAQLSSDVAALSKRIVDIKTEEAKAFAQGRDAQQKGKALEPAYTAKMAEYKPEASAIQARMAKAAEGLDEEVKRYSNLKASKIKNPIVPLYGSSCKGCFTEVDANSRNKLEQDGYVICQNCGRIIYKD